MPGLLPLSELERWKWQRVIKGDFFIDGPGRGLFQALGHDLEDYKPEEEVAILHNRYQG